MSSGRTSCSKIVDSATLSQLTAIRICQGSVFNFQKKGGKKQMYKMKFTYPAALPEEYFSLQTTCMGYPYFFKNLVWRELALCWPCRVPSTSSPMDYFFFLSKIAHHVPQLGLLDVKSAHQSVQRAEQCWLSTMHCDTQQLLRARVSCDFFPKHVSSASSTATSSLPPTCPPSKSSLSHLRIFFSLQTVALPTVSLHKHIGM